MSSRKHERESSMLPRGASLGCFSLAWFRPFVSR
jgi:hypothetical protein